MWQSDPSVRGLFPTLTCFVRHFVVLQRLQIAIVGLMFFSDHLSRFRAEKMLVVVSDVALPL